MEFITCLREQMRLHPAMQPQDVFKLCYQAARGAEHLLSDVHRARAWFDREYAATPADAALPLLEPISPGIARANIAAWKAAGLPPAWLFRMFIHTARLPQGDDRLESYLTEAAALLTDAMPGWADSLAAWRREGMPAIHHSEAYRAAERPAYRIVDGRFAGILPVLQRLSPAVQILAVDDCGDPDKAAQAALLSVVLEAPIIHGGNAVPSPDLRMPEDAQGLVRL